MVEPLLTEREVAEMVGFNGPIWVLDQTRRENDAVPWYLLGTDHGPVRFRASQIEVWLDRRQANRLDVRSDSDSGMPA